MPTTTDNSISRSTVYLAANVIAARKRLRMSQAEFARYIGWPQPRISDIESAKSGKQLSLVDRLADDMDVETWKLLRPRKVDGRLAELLAAC